MNVSNLVNIKQRIYLTGWEVERENLKERARFCLFAYFVKWGISHTFAEVGKGALHILFEATIMVASTNIYIRKIQEGEKKGENSLTKINCHLSLQEMKMSIQRKPLG